MTSIGPNFKSLNFSDIHTRSQCFWQLGARCPTFCPVGGQTKATASIRTWPSEIHKGSWAASVSKSPRLGEWKREGPKDRQFWALMRGKDTMLNV